MVDLERVRLRRPTAVGLVVILCVLAAVPSPWSIGIPPAHADISFGFQTLACWITVLALLIAVVAADTWIAIRAVLVAEFALVAWFAWVAWLVTTPRFARLPFPFMAMDLLGPGWYAAGVGLLFAAGYVVKRLVDVEAPVGIELLWLTTLPGYGLLRLGRWARGLTWTFLFSVAFYLASLDSPDMTLFQEFGRTNNVPPAPITRSPAWILLGLALAFALLSAADTIRERRQRHSRTRTEKITRK